ncbi:RDD family protein [Dactylosporangium sp. CA-233914]|uniref:RDD family protein n=1 Tax=Dactylosporangium sp. CA-233914 TaxID=3239934 RepID=UPI003D94667C
MAYTRGSFDVHVTGRRVVATIIDAILFGIVNTILTEIFSAGGSASGFSATRLSTGNWIAFVFVVAYYIYMEGVLGRTVGKMVTGIRVVDEATGRAPGVGKAAIRTVLRIIDGIFAYLIGFIVVLSSQRRRRLGDMAARTLVVRG